MHNLIDLTGQSFGRLTVLERAGISKGGRSQWLCVCQCDRESIVEGSNLRSGHTKSCGCWQTEVVRATGLKNSDRLKHGHCAHHRPSSTYNSWLAMLQRCNWPKAMSYPRYGGRGITVCERWMKFENFLADMGERPPGTSIDRKDVDGNYEPGNCRWATRKEQRANRRQAARNAA
jgi:hypothetical protein